MLNGPVLQTFINRIFRCRHRHRSFPLTPRGEDQCYAVCLDCGQRLGSDMQVVDRTRSAGPPSGEASDRGKEKVPDPLVSTSARSAPKERETAERAASRPALRARKYDLLSVSFFVVGLSGGLYFFSSTIPNGRSNSISASPVPPSPPAKPLPGNGRATEWSSSRNASDGELRAIVRPEPKSAATKINAARVAPTKSERLGGSNQQLQLEGKTSFVVLGLEAAAIRELSEHPDRLSGLIQSGILFTAPRATAINVLEREEGVVKVLLLEGPMAGREGWVRPSQLRPR